VFAPLQVSTGVWFQFVFSIIGSTIPVPSGSFIPVFKIGAALGRMMGEAMHLWFPYGVHYGNTVAPIIPGNRLVVWLWVQLQYPLASQPAQ
jgi:H+/Cl- antiporter ClcA